MPRSNSAALVLVDIQYDFLPGGALAVPEGDRIIPLANRLQEHFALVVATQDWHPADHGSFAANHPGRRAGDRIDLEGLEQILWPVHCVQESPGARFSEDLQMEKIAAVFQKGTDPGIDSYSGFYDNGHRKRTGLGIYLEKLGVEEVYIAGLATDYCVKFTVFDALGLGFSTHVFADACGAVDLQAGDSDRALAEMEERGAVILNGENWLTGE